MPLPRHLKPLYISLHPPYVHLHLLRLLHTPSALQWRTIHPQRTESHKASHRHSNTRDPGPRARDYEAARPLVVGHVAHADGVLLLDVRQEGALVVDLEVEDAVLVRQRESGGEDSSG